MDVSYEGYELENVPYYEKGKYWLSPMNFIPDVMDTSEVQEQVLVHDVALRDGEQTPGIVFNTPDRIAITRLLSELGVDRIEFGMPIASKDSYEASNLVKGNVSEIEFEHIARTYLKTHSA